MIVNPNQTSGLMLKNNLEIGSVWKSEGTLTAIVLGFDDENIYVYETGKADYGIAGFYEGQGIYAYCPTAFLDYYIRIA